MVNGGDFGSHEADRDHGHEKPTSTRFEFDVPGHMQLGLHPRIHIGCNSDCKSKDPGGNRMDQKELARAELPTRDGCYRIGLCCVSYIMLAGSRARVISPSPRGSSGEQTTNFLRRATCKVPSRFAKRLFAYDRLLMHTRALARNEATRKAGAESLIWR